MSKKDKTCTIYLLRHCESGANVNKITQGHTDSSLTEKGETQAMEIAQSLGGVDFDVIFTSDLSRAKRTAEIIRLNRNVEIKIEPSLREKFFGIFEGVDHDQYIEALKDEFEKFDNHLNTEERWNHKPHSSMESDKELLDRFLPKIKEIIANHLGKKVLVVTHRYAIRMLLLHLGVGEHKNLKAGALRAGGYVVIDSDGRSFFIKELVNAEGS